MTGITPLLAMEVKPNANMGGGEEHVVRVRGLPFSTTSKELVEFFSGKQQNRISLLYHDHILEILRPHCSLML